MCSTFKLFIQPTFLGFHDKRVFIYIYICNEPTFLSESRQHASTYTSFSHHADAGSTHFRNVGTYVRVQFDICINFFFTVSPCISYYYVLLYQLMHLLQVTLKLLKTPLLKNNPTCFDLSRSSSGIHFLVELLLFSL